MNPFKWNQFLTQATWAQIFAKTIFVILEVQFHHERGLTETRNFELFSRHGLDCHHTKNHAPLRPRSTFSEHWPWFWPYLLSENVMRFFCTKFGSYSCLKIISFGIGFFLLRNKHLLLSTFCSFQNPRGHLNL